MADAAAWIECWASPFTSSATTSTTAHLISAAGASSHALHLTPAARGPGGVPPVPPASPTPAAGLSPAWATPGGGGGQGGFTALAVRQYGQVTDRLSTCYSDLMYLALAYNVNVEHQPPTAARQLAPCLGLAPASVPAPVPASALARAQAQAVVSATGQASIQAPAPALIAATAAAGATAAAPLLSHAAEGAYREGRWRDAGQHAHTHIHTTHRRSSSFGGGGEPDQVHDLGPLHDMLLQLPAGSTFCGRYRLTGPPALRKGQGSDGGSGGALSVPASCMEASGTSVTITWYRSSAEYRRQLRNLLAVGTRRQEQEGNRQEGISGAGIAGASAPLLFERIDGLQGLPPALVVVALDS